MIFSRSASARGNLWRAKEIEKRYDRLMRKAARDFERLAADAFAECAITNADGSIQVEENALLDRLKRIREQIYEENKREIEQIITSAYVRGGEVAAASVAAPEHPDDPDQNRHEAR